VSPGEVRARLGRAATVVLDAVGTGASLADAFAASGVAPGSYLSHERAADQLSAYEVSTHERTITGSFCISVTEFRATAQWVGSGPPGLEHLIEARIPLADGPAAFARLASGELDVSKVLVLCQS